MEGLGSVLSVRGHEEFSLLRSLSLRKPATALLIGIWKKGVMCSQW